MAQVLPPDEERAQIYKTKNFTEIKVLLPDGSVVDALPVDINMVVEGIATAENQTNGDQKTQVVDSSGNEVAFESLLDALLKPANTLAKVLVVDTITNSVAITNANLDAKLSDIKAKTDNLDVALSTRLKPADTLTKVSTVDTITNPVAVTNSNLDTNLDAKLSDVLANQTNKNQLTGLVDNENTVISRLNPLCTDSDSVYANDINLDYSTNVGWTGDILDLFRDLHTGMYNDTVTNPKVITLWFYRTVYLNAVGLGCSLAGKSFSNVKIEFLGSDGTVRSTYDDSADNTKYGTRLYSFPPTACVGMNLNFCTTNTDIGLTNLTIRKEINVLSTIQGIDEDTGLTAYIKTSGGDFNVLARLRNAVGNVKINPATSDNQTNGNQKTQIIGVDGTATGTIDANGESVSIAFAGYQSAAVKITGTWSGTMVVEGSVDGGVTYGTIWVSTVNQSPVALGIPVPSNSIMANGTYKTFQTSGFTHYRIRSTAWTSGSASIVWSCTYAPSSFIYTSGAIIQQVVADENNGSEDNLLAGGTFTGTATSTLGVAGLQVSLHTDQNCSVYVEQSPDGTNWDISDYFRYFAGINNFGVTVQAINSYVRVRVVNVSLSATTHFRLQTALCPIVEALPRSLSQRGNLKVAIEEFEDRYGFGVENTPTDEMRVITPYRIVGATFTGTVLDPNFWTASLGTGGSATVGGAQLIVSTGDAIANNSVIVSSVKTARYVGGSALRFRSVFRIPDAGVENNTRRIGAFTTTDGAFLELSGTTFKIVTRKDSVDTAVANGSFNGQLGLGIIIDTNVHTWEIYWQNSKVVFTVDDSVIHTVSATTNTWSSRLDLPIRIENTNSGGLQTNVSLNVRTATIHRLGAATTQPTSKYQAGTTAGVVLKYGPGNLHGIAVSGVSNNSVVTLYDNTAASGTILWSSGKMGANAVPFDIDFKGAAFSIGLTLVISGANSNAMVIYE